MPVEKKERIPIVGKGQIAETGFKEAATNDPEEEMFDRLNGGSGDQGEI